MSVKEGDLVQVRDSYYVVQEIVNSVPCGFPPDCLCSNGKETLRVSTAALTALASATFMPGDRVRMPTFGFEGVVVSDDGGDTVEVTDERVAPQLGKHAKRTFSTSIPRGRLAAANISQLIEQVEN
jgi:hypothetical protein